MPKSIMPKVQKKYSPVCMKFLEMFIISMIFRQQLRRFNGALLHESYDVGIVDMTIHRKNKLQIYVMARMTRFLLFKMMGPRWSIIHHKLMMKMMRSITSQILMATIPRLDVVYSPPFFGSGGGAAATPHLNPPNKLYVEVRLDPGEKLKNEYLFKISLYKVLIKYSKRNVECEFTVSENLVKVFLTFEDPGYLDKVKKILKTFKVDTIQNKKPYTRNLSIGIVKPKKSDKPLLPDFDTELLKKLKKQFGKVSVIDKHSSFLDEDFLRKSNLFLITDNVYLKTLVNDTKRAKVFRKPGLFRAVRFEFRVAHPDCPGLPEKCKDMCEGLTCTFEHGWEYIDDVDLPEDILNSPELWVHGFRT